MRYHLLLALIALLPSFLFAQLTTTVSSTNVTCNGYDDGTATVYGGLVGASAPILITEVNTNTPDFMELTNVSGTTVNTDGWFVITSDDYSNINDVNTLSWSLPSSVNANWVDHRDDNSSSSNYWGNNLFYNNTSSGWVLLSDDNGNIVDFVAWDWDSNSITNTFNVSFGSFTFNITNEWSGDAEPMNSCSGSIIRSGSSDNDDESDWTCITSSSMGSINSTLTLPFTGQIGVSYLWSTGDTTSTVDSLAPGTYYVTTTAQSGGSIVDTVIITEPPVPTFNLPNDTFICDGNAIILDAGSGWDSYAWSSGQTLQTFLLTMPGTYYCTVTDSAGCPASDSIIIGEGESANTDLGNDTSVCADEYLVNAFYPGATYLWNDGTTGSSVTATETGTFAVTVTSSDGCQSMDLINIIMYPPVEIDLGEDFLLCIPFFQTKLLNAGAGYASYMWSDGSTSTTFLAGAGVTSIGTEDISVTVTDDNGCVGSDTVTATYSNCVGIDEATSASFDIYPNPTDGIVQLSSSSKIDRIEIMDLTGKIVFTKVEEQSGNLVELDLSELATGSYFVRITQNEQATVRRMIIR